MTPVFANIFVLRAAPAVLRSLTSSRVRVDGRDISGCIEADEAAGTAECHMADRRGRLVSGDGPPLTYTLHGCVEVVTHPDVRAYLEQRSPARRPDVVH